MVAHLLLKMQLSQCSTISHLLNLSTQSKDMQSNGLNSQRVLGRASWPRKRLKKLRRMQGTSNPQRRGLRGINTPLPKTSRCSVSTDRSDRSPRPVRPVGSNKLAVGPWTGQTGPPNRSDRSGPENSKPLFIRPYLIYQVKT